jgi:ATP-dependent Lon protease
MTGQDTQEAGPTPDTDTVADDTKTRLADDVLLILPVRNLVVFPGAVTQVALGRDISIAAAREAVASERPLGILLQTDPSVDTPAPEDLYRTGTVVSVVRLLTAPNGMHYLICQGEQRFSVVDFVPDLPFLAVRFESVVETVRETPETEALTENLHKLMQEALQFLPQAPPELATSLRTLESPSALADLVAGLFDFKPAEKQTLLEAFDLEARLRKLLDLMSHRIHVLKLSHEIGEQTQEKIDERQREYLLREQLNTIRKELGEDDGNPEIEQIAEAIREAGMPDEVRTQANRELERLRSMPTAAAEHSMVRSYLDWLTTLPWVLPEEVAIDINKARTILDEDHYGLEKVKRRILEYLAVRKLNPEGRSPILCFVGPPGVGKTSLGQSIARALGLRFVRASLGGVHDEAEIRGHRRTYIGSMPGTIIRSVRTAGSGNPVFMLDEMDKLGTGFHGDPSSALLEVLDPEQNWSFRDHYLDVPYDLSRVLFIGTANVLDAIPGPLRDRMEVIELPGYTQEEKLEIAKRYLVERQLKANGLDASQVSIDDDTLDALIDGYTREAGVRNLEREIGALLRHVAVRIVEGEKEFTRIRPEALHEILGPVKFESEIRLRTSVPGVATGLAWTPVGGDILFIEASRVPGDDKLILTGHLGEVMRESAQAALTLAKSRFDTFSDKARAAPEIHIHVPAGAIPKDGPSAGLAMFVALSSLVSGQTVRHDLAMTGEISLRGLVLPVGGIREKVLAARRAGIRAVMLPERNRKDLHDLPESARTLEFLFVNDVDEALAAALEPQDTVERASSAVRQAAR